MPYRRAVTQKKGSNGDVPRIPNPAEIEDYCRRICRKLASTLR